MRATLFSKQISVAFWGVLMFLQKKKKKNTTDESHENKAVRLLQNLRCRLQV